MNSGIDRLNGWKLCTAFLRILVKLGITPDFIVYNIDILMSIHEDTDINGQQFLDHLVYRLAEKELLQV